MDLKFHGWLYGYEEIPVVITRNDVIEYIGDFNEQYTVIVNGQEIQF